MKKIITIIVIVSILGFGIYKVFGSNNTEVKQETSCTTETRLNKEQFAKCAYEQFSKKFDRIEKEKEEAKKKAETEAIDKMWRAVQNISESEGTGFTK